MLPDLFTERLWLSPIVESDAEAVHAQRSDADLMRYIPRVRTKNTDDALVMIHSIQNSVNKGEAAVWGIRLKGDTYMAGSIGLVRIYPEHRAAELGYMLESRFHNRGLMHEAIQAVMHYAFNELKLHRVEAITDPDNHASNAVLEKSGFKREGILRENLLFEGKFLDALYYSVLDREYFKL